ncbi:hypothetical protein LKMONMHP_2784 [Methylobacterium organophilum]|uniref:Uncharacterized protein n=2 Tax=Methylobacterium organophilum TaxID=410 RepID=A0ABQ4TCZ7_METOR|nr:hypothetical protein LKMONMHP_2784 [Methylobacterium organophilum]
MATLHLKGGSWRLPRLRWPPQAEPRLGANRMVITDCLMSTALCVGAAAFLPAAIAPWALATLLNLAGFVWLGVALTTAGPPFGRGHLTAWDGALLSFAASFCVQAAARLGVLGT